MPDLSPADQAEIDRITAEIMAGMDCFQPSVFERHVKQVLAREIMAAAQMYDEQAAEEEVHRATTSPAATYKFPDHPISECDPRFCGRYRGQRRVSAESVARQEQALEDFSRYGCLDEPVQLKPEASRGPATED